MDTVLDRPWTTDSFLAWEDRQEGKHEFDGRHAIPMTGGSVAHQEIVPAHTPGPAADRNSLAGAA